MADSSALLPQEVHHVTENDDLVIPDDGHLLPFADVVDVYDWTSEVPINPRTGVGHIDPQKFDRGQEQHTFSVDFNLQGSIALPTTSDGSVDAVNCAPVYEAIIRKANNMLNRRTIVWKVEHPGEGVDGAGRDVYVVARHCAPNTVTLAGDAEENSPISVSLEYMAPKIRPYTLDQPGSSTTLSVESTESESGDVTIWGLDDTDSETSETLSLTDGSGTTTATFKAIYGVWLETDFAGDVTVTDGSGTTYTTIYGSETYWGIEGDKGIPATPDSGSKVSTHDGDEQKFLDNTATWQGTALAPEYNSVELEVNNNIETKNTANRIGVELRPSTRETTLSATVAGPKQPNQKADAVIRKLMGDLIWNLSQNTITLPNSVCSDPGSKVYTAEEAFASVDVEFTSKGIEIT